MCVPEVRNKTALLNMGATLAASPPDCFRPSKVPSHSARCPPQSSFQPLPHNAAHAAHPPAPAHVFPGQHKAMRLRLEEKRDRRQQSPCITRPQAGQASSASQAGAPQASAPLPARATSCLSVSTSRSAPASTCVQQSVSALAAPVHVNDEVDAPLLLRDWVDRVVKVHLQPAAGRMVVQAST